MASDRPKNSEAKIESGDAGAAPHFDGKRFFQPGVHPERLFRDFLKWRLTSRPARWPRHVMLNPQPPPPSPTKNQLVITWVGHATFLVQTVAGNVLFDPVFSDRVSPFRWIGPRRVHDVPIALEALPQIDAVCVTHDHYDHFDADTLRWLARRRPETTFITPLRHRDLLSAVGVERMVELDWWDSHPLSPGLKLTLTPTKHWTNRLGTPRNYRLWGGFWMEFSILDSRFSIPEPEGSRSAGAGTSGARSGELLQNQPMRPKAKSTTDEAHAPLENRESKIQNQRPCRRLWFVGDSGYDERLFREIRERVGMPDVALVPIGAYEPRWFMAPMHMNPAEAVRLHQEIGARLSLGMHWGTFQLTDESREQPVTALAEARAANGLSPEQFRVLDPGESVVV